MAKLAPDAPGSTTSPPPTAPPDLIGREGDNVRVVSFGPGGFDTVMQLGLIHALLVIQGRAPDGVVGISAGAINAVSLAEVLQAGEEIEGQYGPWEGLSHAKQKELQRRRLEARVARFQQILDRVFRTPRELVEGLLPDAYQVDSQDPFQSVQSPLFLESERNRRDEALANRAGLVRLYNALLDLRLTFGTLTRAVRRFLGIKAAEEVRNPLTSFGVKLTEFLRFWVIAGANLGPIARLLPFLVWPWLRARFIGALPEPIRRRALRPKGVTAGAIVYRFRGLWEATDGLLHAVVFTLVLTLWVGVTLLPALLPWLVNERVITASPLSTPLAYAIVAGFLAMAAVAGAPTVREFDRTTWWRMLRDVGKSGVVTTGLVALWFGVLTSVIVLVATAQGWYVGGRPLGDAFEDGMRAALLGTPRLLVAAGVVGLLALLTWLVVPPIVRGRAPAGAPRTAARNFFRDFLEYYRIRRSLFCTYALERFFSDLFDPDYWGHVPVDGAVSDALGDSNDPWPGPRKDPDRPRPKRLSHYADAKRRQPIRVGLSAADLESGRLEVVPLNTPVVDGLAAATAVVPFFPPRIVCGKHYVDGVNVTRSPLEGVLSLLKKNTRDDIKPVHIYAVSSLPLSWPTVDGLREEEARDVRYDSLVDVAFRALRLQRFRDGTLERRLTELYSKVMPPGQVVVNVPPEPVPPAPDAAQYLRTWVTPVEPDTPIDINAKLFRASVPKARTVILETVADGCRASLEVMIRKSQEGIGEGSATIPCAEAVTQHLAKRCEKHLEHLSELPFPGSEEPPAATPGAGPGKPAGNARAPLPQPGPGLTSVCHHCAFRRSDGDERKVLPRTLHFHKRWKQVGPAWPHERESPEGSDDRFDTEVSHPTEEPEKAPGKVADAEGGDSARPRWPRHRVPRGTTETMAHAAQPIRSLLFSGGVFRGVYQMGVLNALTQLQLRPDLIAGASVGAITAAMTASVFPASGASERDDEFTEEEADVSTDRVMRLAAVYLALDRLVLTDRFADFIRNFTVRAAEAHFSIRQADRVFRAFDRGGFRPFEKDVRTVLAGLERLLYVSPFEVKRFVEAVRDRKVSSAMTQLRDHAQEWLERMDVGDEILGSEPLRRLIDEYVVDTIPETDWRYIHGPEFDVFRERSGIHFLATATNLTRSRLEILGMRPSVGFSGSPPMLPEGLLASSAFPGVFRPREAHEIFPNEAARHQYIDGGVMDNLPLDAVAEFLLAAAPADAPLITRRPSLDGTPRPHLVFTASLEVRAQPYAREDLDDLSWPELMGRTSRLGYNRKLDTYAAAQRALRALRSITEPPTGNGGEDQSPNEKGARPHSEPELEPLDLDLVVVKPTWLCKTFAFHPMLGFRRVRQAKSIAHGCATTLVAFGARCRHDEPAVGAWGLEPSWIPDYDTLDTALEATRRRRGGDGDGSCWLVPEKKCPFALQAAEERARRKNTPPLHGRTAAELHKIYRECRNSLSHGVER